MKKIISVILVAVMLSLAMTALVSCGGSDDAGPEISVYLGEEVYDFDPTDYYVSDNAAELMSLLFEPLFRITDGGKLENAAASGYSVNKEERKIEITLKESYWSDKSRVTAEDFIYSWRNVLLEPNNASPAAALLYDIEGAMAIKSGEASVYSLGVEKTGVYELTITYREGADYNQLIRNLAALPTSPIKQDVHENSPATWTKNLVTAVTNGPFMLGTVNHELGELTVERNPGYHQSPYLVDKTGQVTPDKLVTFIVEGESRALTYADLTAKTVFYLGEAPLSDLAANKANAKTADSLSTYSYVFNTENPLFAIKEVRQALSMAIDRTAIANAVTFGEAATGFLPSGVLDIGTNKSFSSGSLISADAKLDAAKNLLNTVDLSGIDKTIEISVNDDERSLKIAELVKASWESLDIGLVVTVVPVGAVSATITDFTSGEQTVIYDSGIQVLAKDAAKGTRSFDVIGIDWQMYSEDAMVALMSFTSSLNGNGVDYSTGKARTHISGWWSYEYDTLMNAASVAGDKATRAEKLHAAEAVLADAVPIAPILFNTNYAFVSADLSGLKTDIYGNFSFVKVSQRDYKKYIED